MASNEAKRFSFYISFSKTIDIQLTEFYGTYKAFLSFNSNYLPDIQISNRRLILEPENITCGKYYLSIIAEDKCQVALVVNQENIIPRLLEGLPTSSELVKDQTKSFRYSIPLQSLQEKKICQLKVFVHFEEKVSQPVLYLRYISKRDYRLPSQSLHDFQFVYDPDLRQLGGSIEVNQSYSSEIALSLSDKFGNNYGSAIKKFSIIAWTAGRALLVPGYQVEGTLKHPGDYRIILSQNLSM